MNLHKLQLIFIVFTISLFLTSCSDSGSSATNTDTPNTISTPQAITTNTSISSTPIFKEFQTTVDALSKLSIDTTAEFTDSFNNMDPLEFFLNLQSKDETINPEDMLNLMKILEKEIVLVPLANEGKITSNSLKSLQVQDLSLVALKSGPLRPWSAPDDNASLNTTTKESYNRQQWIAYNNNLAAFGEAQLSLEEFIALKNAINDVPVLFVNFGDALQNVDINSSSSSGATLSPGFKSAPGLAGTFNPTDETLGALRAAPTPYLEFAPHNFLACYGIERSYPFQVMGTHYVGGSVPLEFVDTSAPLLGDKGDQRYFQINEKGLAELLLFNTSTTSVTISLEHKENTLTSLTLAPGEKQKIFIPVMDADVCVPYYLTKEDLKIQATLLQLHKPSTMNAVFDSQRGAYDLENRFTISSDGDTFLQASITEFTLIDITENSSRQIYFDDYSSRYQAIQYIVEAPSGKLYSQLGVGDGSLAVDAENGKWLIYAFPMVGANYQEYEFDSSNLYTHMHAIKESQTQYPTHELSLSLSTNKLGNLKKFVIAEMKNAEFSHDGESTGHAAEVTLSLHSNMAPRLDFGEDISNAFTGNESYSAQQCWITHNRDVNHFKTNQACYEMQGGMQKIYEDYMCKNFSQCVQFGNVLPSLSSQSDTTKQNLFVWYTKELNKQLNDERFKLMYETYLSLYEEWKNSVVQINDMKYPSAYHYGIQDSKVIKSPTTGYPIGIEDFYHPNIPMNIPVFAVTKERMATSSSPFAFEYSAYDADEVDSSAQLFAVAKLIVNQALAVVTGNYAALVCNTVDTMQEMRQNEINGEDDPIGEADFFLNRFSAEDSFYGISTQKELTFAISGLATIPNHYTSYDRNLEYAALACDISGAVIGGYNLYNSLGTLLSGDLYTGLGLSELRLDALEGIDENSDLYGTINDAFDAIENGTASADIFETLKASTQLDAFGSGVDIFNSLLDVSSDLGGLGGKGHNVMRSEANYFFSSFQDRKTRSNIVVKEIDGQPITNVKVTLNSIQIQDNYEDGDAEVKLRTRVGIVSDEKPTYQGSFSSNAPFMVDGELAYDNGSNGYETLPNLPFKGYLLKSKNYNGIADGDEIDVEGMDIYDANYPTNNNAAAIFVEVGLYEGDGGGVDDDMIGVFSKTFYLEDIYNIIDGERWNHSGKVQTLRVWVPVYNAQNLATSVELLDMDNRTKQLAHNEERIQNASAYISFTIEVTLGEYVDYERVDVGVANVDGDPSHGKPAMDMSLINLHEVSYLQSEKLQLHEVYQNQAVLLDSLHGIRVAKISEDNNLSWRTSINATNLPQSYATLLDDVYTNSFRFEPIHGTRFIDENHLLVFQRNVPGGQEDVQLIVMDIGENNSSVAVRATMVIPSNSKNITSMRIDANHIKLFISVANMDDNSGSIDIYDIGVDSIAKVGTYTLAFTPTDLLAIDSKTLLVKSENFKHRHFTSPYETDEYWTKELYLHLLEIDSNDVLSAKDVKQYTYAHHDYSQWSGVRYPQLSSSAGGLRNINSGLLNRIVHTGVYNIPNNIFPLYLNLVYNSDTGSYRFGSVRKPRIPGYIENPDYAYYIDSLLNASPNDLSREGKVYLSPTQIFQTTEQRFSSAKNIHFLDSRYLLSLIDVLSSDLTRPSGYELVLVDTLHIDNSAPTVTSDDFNQTHIVNYANSYTTSIDFTVTDAERGVDDFNVSFNIVELENNTTIFTGTDTSIRVHNDDEFWYEASLECQSDGSCHMDITYPKVCTSLSHRFEINIQDYDITVTKAFTLQLMQTKPHLIGSDISVTSYRYIGRYSEESASFTSDAQNSCSSIGFVNRPSWVSAGTSWALGDPDEISHLTILPHLGDAGEYDVSIYAYNEDFESEYVNLHITVQQTDTTPDNLSFTEFNDVNQSELIESTLVVDGINAPVAISILNGEYSLDGSTWTSDTGEVVNGDNIYVRHTSSADYLGEVNTTLTIGTSSALLISRVIQDPNINDTTPNQFHFTDNLNANITEVLTSSITISGLNTATELTISNGEYSLNGGKAWSTEAVNVDNEQSVTLRHTSSSEFNTTVETTLNIGGISDTFSSRTILMPLPVIDNYPVNSIEINELFSFTPATSGGEVASWSIENKPSWLDFNSATGELSGSSQNAGDFENIKIIATNTTGSSERLFSLTVRPLSTPYIDGGLHNLDETSMSFSFSDNSAWRDAITSVSISIDYENSISLSIDTDYTISAGQILLSINGTNSIPTTPGEWILHIEAVNYYDNDSYIWVESGQADLSHAQNTLTLNNAPFAKGKHSSVKFQLQDRFKNPITGRNTYFDMERVNNDLTFIEPYSIKNVSNTFYNKVENRQSFSSNENGWVEADLLIPGCVDSGDGFTLNLKDNQEREIGSFDFSSDSNSCVDSEWIKRFDINNTYTSYSNMKITSDESGNLYIADNYQDNGIYMAKVDRNGVTRWERTIITGQRNSFYGIIQNGDELYIAANTTEYLAGDGGSNAGGEDIVFIKLEKATGNTVYIKQWGTLEDEKHIGFNTFANGVILHILDTSSNDSQYTKLNFLYDGTLQNEIGFATSSGINHVTSLANGSTISIYSQRTFAWDENLNSQWYKWNAAGSSYYSPNRIWDDNAIYLLGNARGDSYFNDTFQVNDIYFETLVKRDYNGNFIWSHSFDKWYAQDSARGVSINNILYIAYSNNVDEHIYAERYMNIVALNSFDGSLIEEQSFEAGTHMSGQVTVGDTIKPKDMTIDASLDALYIVGTATQKLSNSNPNDGKLFIMKMIKTGSVSDTRSGYTRDNYHSNVNDFDNNLQWYDYNSSNQDSWSNIDCTFEGWRLPTLSELQTTVDTTKNPAIESIFTQRNTEYDYWTNEASDEGAYKALHYGNQSSTTYTYSEDTGLNYRCVRDLSR